MKTLSDIIKEKDTEKVLTPVSALVCIEVAETYLAQFINQPNYKGKPLSMKAYLAETHPRGVFDGYAAEKEYEKYLNDFKQ